MTSEFNNEELLEFLYILSIFSTQKRSINNIHLSVEKSSRVIFSLKKYLNIDIEENPRDFILEDEIKKSIKVFDSFFNDKVDLNLNCSTGIVLHGVPNSLNFAWRNIIFNSIQAFNNSASKTMKINIFKDQGDVVLEFVDSGTGIPESIHDKIFSPFFTTKSRGEGIGLGLYVTKKIIEEHNGKISFHSLDGMTQFKVILPIST